LGPYEVHAPNGAGGVVNSEGFGRVAQPIAALNYARTCQIHDVGPNCGVTIGEMAAYAHIALVRRALGTSHPNLAIESFEETPLNRRGLLGQASSL
jgi:hypothetical protein